MLPFTIDDYTAWRLLEGLDDIGLTLRKQDEIDAFEQRRPSWKPRTICRSDLAAAASPKSLLCKPVLGTAYHRRCGATGLPKRSPAIARNWAWLLEISGAKVYRVL